MHYSQKRKENLVKKNYFMIKKAFFHNNVTIYVESGSYMYGSADIKFRQIIKANK